MSTFLPSSLDSTLGVLLVTVDSCLKPSLHLEMPVFKEQWGLTSAQEAHPGQLEELLMNLVFC